MHPLSYLWTPVIGIISCSGTRCNWLLLIFVATIWSWKGTNNAQHFVKSITINLKRRTSTFFCTSPMLLCESFILLNHW